MLSVLPMNSTPNSASDHRPGEHKASGWTGGDCGREGAFVDFDTFAMCWTFRTKTQDTETLYRGITTSLRGLIWNGDPDRVFSEWLNIQQDNRYHQEDRP